MASQRSSVGVAIVARDAEGTIAACIDSIRPFAKQVVVCVDVATTDRTARVARKRGAEVHPIRVSEPHECQYHGKVLAQHFARARNESFTHLDKSLEWWMWLDADDVVRGGGRLADVTSAVPEEAIGIWLPYRYSTLTKDGVEMCNTTFHRERLLRSAVGWTWENRVHEVVVPRTPGPWIKTDLVEVVHQHGAHKPESSASRNQLLLEIELEENPANTRAVFYIANGYFAVGDWLRAAEWYERYTEVGSNPYELWQSYVYMSMAYQRLGDLNAATQAAYGALDVNPHHPEPYYQLAAIYGMAGEDEKVEFWTKMGRQMKEPPFFVFQNPADGAFNNRVCLADSYARQGRIVEARAELEKAYAAFPDERVGQAIRRYAELEAAAERADALVTTLAGKTDEETVRLYEAIDPPVEVRQFGRVRDLVMPAYLRRMPSTQPRIAFFCGRSYEEWAPPSLNQTGIGGSETAVIEIAKRFAADGWRADVYNDCGKYEGVYDGVGYWDCKRWAGQPDVLVSWRNPKLEIGRDGGSLRRVLWCHDLNYGPDAGDAMRRWDAVLGVSAWHAGMLRDYYGVAADYVPNGIDPARFDPSIEKVPFRCVYASSPDRGLLRLLSLWPRVLETEPAAELHVAYGWETFDRMAVSRPDMQAFKKQVVEAMERTPGVVCRGRLPQDELARLYCESYCWTYPTDFLEVSCISAMEAMAGGCLPVASAIGALRETVGNHGVLVPGMPHSSAWRQFYTHVLRGILADRDARMSLSSGCRGRAKDLTWDRSYEAHWKPIVARLLGERKAA